MTTISQKQGSVVAVSHDMIMVRFEGKGVLFKKNTLTRAYKHDDIVQFSAKKASTVDIEVGDKLSQMANYEIAWLGTEIKYIKAGRLISAEGAVITIPDERAQYMFVDWKYTKNPPALAKIPGCSVPLTTNVFVTRAAVRPEVDKLTEMFKPGQKVKFVAREQAPNERGVCWRAAIATDEYHDIVSETPLMGRTTHKVIPKAGVAPPIRRPVLSPIQQKSAVSTVKSAISTSSLGFPAPTVQRPLTRPPAPVLKAETSRNAEKSQKPPPVDGFDYFDTCQEACDARFNQFAKNYRNANPDCISSQKSFEALLRIKYLNHVKEEMMLAAELEN